jgi:NAD(P)H-hydrate epimerase
MTLCTNTDALPAFPSRSEEGFKGTFGTVVVVAGHRSMIGAPCFVAQGALRSGCGVVRLAVPPDILMACLTIVPSAIGLDLPQPGEAWLSGLDDRSVIAAGPGLGIGAEQAVIIQRMLGTAHALVLDGDGLTHLAHVGAEAAHREQALILTPHVGEYGRLSQRWGLPALPAQASAEERQRAAMRLAEAARAVVVLKGHRSIIATHRTAWISEAGCATLAIPGSGDVLTGIVSALLAQGMAAVDAARLGVHVHGLAGDQWSTTRPFGLLALELADLIPSIAQSLRSAR